jgi:hypothetical protein
MQRKTDFFGGEKEMPTPTITTFTTEESNTNDFIASAFTV